MEHTYGLLLVKNTLLTFFSKCYLKIRRSPFSSFFPLKKRSCLLLCVHLVGLWSHSGFSFLISVVLDKSIALSGLNILFDKQNGCWTCAIVCLWSQPPLNKCEGHGFEKRLWISRFQVALLIIKAIGILSLVLSKTIINCYYLPAFQT